MDRAAPSLNAPAGPAPAAPRARIVEFWARVVRAPWAHQRIELYQELSSLAASGFGIRQAVESLHAKHGNRGRHFLEPLLRAVEAGEALAPAMRRHPDIYTGLECALVGAGETTGRMDHAFRAAADQVDRVRRIRNRILAAVAYPLFLVNFGLVVMPLGFILIPKGLGAYLAFVIPVFVLLWGAIVGGITLHVAFAATPGYARFLLRVPILGRAIESAAISRFARALAALHGAGIRMDEALRVAAEATGNAWMHRDLLRAVPSIERGSELAEALTTARALPPDVWRLIATGEQAGELEETLGRAAELYEDRFERLSKQLPVVLFVVMLALVGLVVLVVAFGLIMDIASMYRGL